MKLTLNLSKGVFLFLLLFTSLSFPAMAADEEIVIIKNRSRSGHAIIMDGEIMVLDGNGFNFNVAKASEFVPHRALLELGITTLQNVDYVGYDGTEEVTDFLDLKPIRSMEVNLNLGSLSAGLNRSGTLGCILGIGLGINNYVFEQLVTLTETNGRIMPVELADKYKKTKLTTTYLTFPLLFQVQMPQSQPVYSRFSFTAGVIGGVLINQHTKIKNPKEKEKLTALNPWRLGVTARMAIDRIQIYSTYYFTELFEDGKGPVANPLSVGVAFGL